MDKRNYGQLVKILRALDQLRSLPQGPVAAETLNQMRALLSKLMAR